MLLSILLSVGATLCGCPGQTRRSSPTNIVMEKEIHDSKTKLFITEGCIGLFLIFNTLITCFCYNPVIAEDIFPNSAGKIAQFPASRLAKDAPGLVALYPD